MNTSLFIVALVSSAAGDARYAGEESAPVALSAPQKNALGAAIAASSPIDPIVLDEVDCWSSYGQTVITQCRAWSTPAVMTDNEYFDNAKPSSAVTRKKYGPIPIPAGALLTWDTFTQGVWSIDMQAMYRLRCKRSGGTINCSTQPLSVVSKAQFRIDHGAGLVAKKLGIIQ